MKTQKKLFHFIAERGGVQSNHSFHNPLGCGNKNGENDQLLYMSKARHVPCQMQTDRSFMFLLQIFCCCLNKKKQKTISIYSQPIDGGFISCYNDRWWTLLFLLFLCWLINAFVIHWLLKQLTTNCPTLNKESARADRSKPYDKWASRAVGGMRQCVAKIKVIQYK